MCTCVRAYDVCACACVCMCAYVCVRVCVRAFELVLPDKAELILWMVLVGWVSACTTAALPN